MGRGHLRKKGAAFSWLNQEGGNDDEPVSVKHRKSAMKKHLSKDCTPTFIERF